MQKVNAMLPVALSSVAAGECLQIDALLARSMKAIEIKPKPKGETIVCATWRPKNSIFFTLIKTKNGTAVYCHLNGTAYHATPLAQLSTECPEGTVFLAQWCIDGGTTHRLLVFDLLDNDNVISRGEKLRQLSRFLPRPLCVLQWAGEPEALEGFTSTLPHPVECVVALTENPLKLHRVMHVTLPTHLFPKGTNPGKILLN